MACSTFFVFLLGLIVRCWSISFENAAICFDNKSD